MMLLFASLVDVAIVLALGLTAAAVLRRRPAALRHAIVSTAIIAASLMPIFEIFLPQLPILTWHDTVTVLSSELTLSSDHVISGPSTGRAAPPQAVPWGMVFLIVWMAGAIATCAALITGLVRLARLTAGSVPVTGRWRELTDEISSRWGLRRHVRVLQGRDPSILVTCGLLRPTIILPAVASEWTDDRKRIVLCHELAHVTRHDAVMQIAAETLRVLHWMNPIVWLACRRLRQESEFACDDVVMSAGVQGTEYAAHLLGVARDLSGRRAGWTAAPAIAHPSTLERRIGAMLQQHRNRAPLSRAGWLVIALLALAVGIPVAASGVEQAGRVDVSLSDARDVMLPAPAAPLRTKHPVPAMQAGGTITGNMLDQSGGTLPGVQLTLTETQSGLQFTVNTDAEGRFAFRDLQPGRYELVARLLGFSSVSNVFTVRAGTSLNRTITMPVGTLQETITVSCAAPPASPVARLIRGVSSNLFPVLSAQERMDAAIRVGGNIRPPTKLTDVRPVCPPFVPAGETTVRLAGRIGVDGHMNDVKVVPDETGAEIPTELSDSALDAARQWTFSATLLNGRPIEVNINVRVVFRKS